MLSLPELLRKLTRDIEDLKSHGIGGGGGTGGGGDTPADALNNIKNLVLEQVLTSPTPKIDAAWDPPEGAFNNIKYRVYCSYDGGANYFVIGESQRPNIQIPVDKYGEIYIRITATYENTAYSATSKVILKQASTNELKEFAIGQQGYASFFTVVGTLANGSSCTIEIRRDGKDWDTAYSVCSFIGFPFSFSSYIPEGKHLFRARICNNGIYQGAEKTFPLNVRSDRPDGEVVKEIDSVQDKKFNIDGMLHTADRIFGPMSIRFEQIWDKDFDDIHYMTFGTLENMDVKKPLNMNELTFDTIWNDTMDSVIDYNSYFEIIDAYNGPGEVTAPVIDLEKEDVITFNYDFECNVVRFNNQSALEIVRNANPQIYIRYSSDNEHWTNWQLYMDASYVCRYVQYKLVFEALKSDEDVEITKLKQTYSLSPKAAADIQSIINSIFLQV